MRTFLLIPLLVVGALSGCQTGGVPRHGSAASRIGPPVASADVSVSPSVESLRPAAGETGAAHPAMSLVQWQTPTAADAHSTFAQSADYLQVDVLVAEVLSRHPDIQSAVSAWRAAAQRYPQEIALDDPMFGYMLGPGTWGSDTVESAYMLEASQKIPWPGKRQLRGDMARAEASAACFDVQEQRLRIAETTKLAFYEYFLAHRQLAVLEESASLLRRFREIALRRFESAAVEQQDVLLADVELAQLDRQRLALERAERVARARINTLLLEAPNRRLAAPPQRLEVRQNIPSSDDLIDLALAQRPELAAQAARIRRERYSAALARQEFLPDMEFVARYDAFWQERELRPMIGMNVNVPIYTRKRVAALREANARAAQQQGVLESKAYEISYEVERNYQRVAESVDAVRVFEQQILPSARHSVEAAEASYAAGRLDFLRLVESQRQFLSLQDGYYAAIAEYYERLAELERQVGADF